MRLEIALAVVVVLSALAAIADVVLKDEGSTLGPVTTLVCMGSAAQCSRVGSGGIIYVDGGH